MSGFRSGRIVILGLFALLVLGGFAFGNPTILSADNVSSMAVFAVELGIIAFGQGLVIQGGDGAIDLSVGAMSGLAQVLTALFISRGLPWPVGVGIGIASGAAMGGCNAAAIARFRIPPIIATLGTMFAFSGLALIASDGNTIDLTAAPAPFLAMGQGTVLGVPFQILCLYLPLLAVLVVVQHRSRFGRALYLVGTNATAAWLAGIPVKRLRAATYVLSGALSGLAGVIAAARLGTATPDGVPEANLISIAIVVLGGASIFGGDGSPIGTAIATIAIAVVNYGLNYNDFNPTLQAGMMGLILVLIVLVENVVVAAVRGYQTSPGRT
ncbi:Monosaccharide-transporting ATPase [Gluconacetobacter diazotrophicus PA1 5]|uniref:Autoinducer 2 import system permease protein LsrD n=2 Tax=Gluconacetobacter diazotrophicus TaxID=33996 RepID=A9HG08_GLUDA|nr:ABC transporter permease [Gluconacetobacter diazotrophicus]ACI51947.1 Monosaccharide-transporting ATPase [Gluconacetobacter diazotrophicus PA1 5]MBB2157118.1 ABC transporter permease [Gluconacetobacter diazotrophicus]TWB05148.1 monosaccharide ABC transporter membrane protein (CUT2 family) [Gluconacetobacter diazotrophicus]CAP55435.1 Ribose transport system permease protein rbsC [Gluconacetobacter diazotrophicus PA1 5]